jgi:hypothetical protein
MIANSVLLLCGPLALLPSPYWPLINAALGPWGESATSLVIALLAWTVWSMACLKTRVGDMSLRFYLLGAVGWFVVAPFALASISWALLG